MQNEQFPLSPAELVRRMIDIAHGAADLVKNASFSVEVKDGFSNIVTTSDLLAQRFLCEKLGKLIPSAGFLCEEENLCDTREYTFVIDPIDGTTNYARGISDSAICVALLHGSEVMIGVVVRICDKDTFSAVKGEGAWRNGQPIHVADRPFASGLLCTAMSLYDKSRARACSDIIYDAYLQCNDIRRLGSCALELCYLAAGLCDLYFEIRVFPWDFAASSLILSEAGGVLTGADGKAPPLDRETTLIGAATRDNHQRLCEIVARHLNTSSCEE